MKTFVRTSGWACAMALSACQAATPVQGNGIDLAGASPPGLSLQNVQRQGASETNAQGGVQQRYVFTPAPLPQLVLNAPASGWDWSGDDALRIEVQNGMAWDVGLQVDIDGATPDQHLHALVPLPAGPAQTVVIPLHETSPRAYGMQAGPPMPVELDGKRVAIATTVQGHLDVHTIHAIHLAMPAPQAPQTLLFGKVGTSKGDVLHALYSGIVDRYGQYTRSHGPEQVGSDESLRTLQARAAETLAANSANLSSQDRFGGRTDLPAFKANGWFRSEKRDGHWYLVTPDGHAFFSLGMNAVMADGGRSYVQGRETMFRDLPPASGAWAPFYGSSDTRQADAASRKGLGIDHGRWFDFYAANLYRLDGTSWRSAWAARTLARLKGWGFNTIGNWSDDGLARAQKLAYTRSINIDGIFGNVSSGYDYWGRMPDPYDPRFVQAADRAVVKATQDVANDPWLLGYFADNELAWAGQGPQGRWGLATGTLRGEAQSPAKQAFIARLKAKYGDAIKLGAAWGISLTSWDAMAATGFVPPDPSEAHPAIAADYSDWLRDYAKTYFRVVSEALRKHDSHHLLLGGRFAVNTPEAVAACVQYCDVVSFNTYTDVPQHGFDEAAIGGAKPVLITEFHFGSNDRGPFGNGVASVYNEQQRGEAYQRFIAAAAKDPNIVGAHWFQYVDEPVTGRLLDGENMHIGLVGITDVPFGSFVEAVRKANAASGTPSR